VPRDTRLLKLLLHAYPDRVTVRREPGSPRGLMVGGRGVELEPASVVRKAPLFLSIDPRDGVPGANGSRVRLASAIEPEWLAEVHPHLLAEAVTHRFDAERERVVTARTTTFAGLVVREVITGAREDPEGAAMVLAEAAAPRLESLVAEDDTAGPLLARLRFLNTAAPDLGLPAADAEGLAARLAAWCGGCHSLDDLRRRGWANFVAGLLDWNQRRQLDEHAPEALAVPSGNRIRLRYGEGDAPVLAVRLQELFGMTETPRVARGRVAVVVHLLGPNYRPVQVTSDLASFWRTTYAEVRKELRARYPKHPWPENPLDAQAVAVGQRRRPPA
jgi:ATP-dependent helicase HrpB